MDSQVGIDDFQVKFCWVDIPAFSRAYLPPAFHPNGHWLKRAVSITREQLPIDIYSEAELDAVNNFYIVKRQAEWLAGRFAAKSLISQCLGNNTGLSTIEVWPRGDGSPRLAGSTGEDADITISLSHSNQYAICGAVCGRNSELGVDVEKIEPHPSAELLEVGFTARELETLADCPAEDVYRSWTIKEAYLKYCRRGFNENLHNVEIIDDHIIDAGVSQDHLMIVAQPVFESYCLSTVMDSSHL